VVVLELEEISVAGYDFFLARFCSFSYEGRPFGPLNCLLCFWCIEKEGIQIREKLEVE